MDRKYTIYEHISPENKRYIGITSQSPSIRWRRGMGYRKNIHFFRAIQKYGWENFQHNILKENVEENDAKRIEIELIKRYKTTDPNFGYNVTRGGDTRQPCPEEVKEKIRNKNKGKIVSEGTKKKISLAKKGVPKGPMTQEQKEKVSKSLIGNKRALGHHNYISPIAMCDMENNIIKTFKGAPIAAKELNCSDSGILRACKENSKSCGLENTKYGGIYAGYKWFYLDENNNIVNNNFGEKINLRNQKIVQYDLLGNKINEFKKIKEAAESNGFSKNGLSFALKNKKEVEYKGFIWVRV